MIIKYADFLIEKLGFKNYKDFILLIGPPGIGKSFYTNKLKKTYDIFKTTMYNEGLKIKKSSKKLV